MGWDPREGRRGCQASPPLQPSPRPRALGLPSSCESGNRSSLAGGGLCNSPHSSPVAMSSGGKSERRFGNVCVCGMRVWEHTDKQRGGAVLVPPPPRGLQVGVPYTEWGGGPRGRLHLRGGRGRQLGAALAWLCLGSQAWESSQSWESASEPGPLRVLMYIHIVSTCSVGAASSSPSARERMQEVIAGLERFTFTFEKDVEMQKGTGLLPFQGMDSE